MPRPSLMRMSESRIVPSFDLEAAEMALGGGPVVGIDEAGRGPWAGPVVAAAVILDPQRIPQGIDDSKMLDAEEPVTAIDGTRVIEHTRTLLKPSEEGDGFGKHYYDALQRAPDVGLAHAELRQLLR